MLKTYFGTNRFHWRCLSLSDVSCVIGCRRRLTWFPRASSLQILILVWLVVVVLSLPNTCSLLVASLVRFGHLSELGLDFRRRMHIASQTILFSSLIQRAVRVPDGLFYSLFGSLVFGLCGMRETSESSIIQRTRCIRYWTKSSYFHIGGWGRLILL
jgi:hypothetical protein